MERNAASLGWFGIQSLISAHPEEGCPAEHRTMDDPHVHLPVNKLWTDKLDLSLKILKISAQHRECS